jgi:hypothetical protein
MKKLILFIGFGIFVFAGNTNAQTCAHGKSAEAKVCTKPTEAAIKAASMDPSIETKTCKTSGSVCFVKKTTDAQGNVATAEVKYDEATAQFVSITEANAGTVKSCSTSKACCAKGAKNGKACCKAKSSAAVNTAPAEAETTKDIKSN